MEKIVSFITKNIISILGVTILTGTTVATSALGVVKVANSFHSTNLEVPHEQQEQTSSSSQSINQSSFQTTRPNPIALKTSSSSSSMPTSTSGSSSSTNTNSQCIITLFGNKYDVTSLTTTHSGGNVFSCGTDMTTVYQGQHGTNLSRMQPYLITSNSGGTTSSSGQTIGGPSLDNSTGEKESHLNKNEDHDEEHEIENE